MKPWIWMVHRSLCVGMLALGVFTVHGAVSKPSVLVFLIDDLGRSDLGADGSSFHKTPRLDALAKSGDRTELYDLKADPGETADLSTQQPERTESLRDELLRWIGSTIRATPHPR